MRRRRLVPAAALTAALLVPQAARAATLANVYVDGPVLTAAVDSASLGSPRDGNYRQRGRAGDPATDNPHSGWSVHDILGAANASGAAAVDVLGGEGRWYSLDGHELDQPTDAFENDLVPIVW